MSRFQRYDVGPVSFEPTPQGGMRGPANFTRTGVFVYKLPDGSIRRELRHPDDVFHADSVASLEDAPMTDGHPIEGMVTPSNYKRLAIGHVRDVRVDGRFLAGTSVVQEGASVTGIRAKSKRDLSCGYTCDLIHESGVYNGEKYDARQTNIAYNHVALLGPGKGRAGSEVRLRVDGNEEPLRTDETGSAPAGEPAKGFGMDPKEIAQIMADVKAEKARADAAEKALSDARQKEADQKARADKAEGERDAEKAKREALEGDLKKERESFGARVDARIAVVKAASVFLPKDYAFAGKSNREIQVDALKAQSPKFDAADKSDDYVQARFDAMGDSPSGETRSGLATKPSQAKTTAKQDADDDEGETEIPAWQKPLATSKG